MSRKKWAIMLILLLAAALRLWALSDVPPGMTHDEADHGLDAWGVVQGIRPIYFPTAYGREPFFDYATAILMSFLGPIWLAGRYVSVFSGLIMIAGTYAWARLAFNERVALLAAAGLSVNFWALMTARHALRSVTLPMVFVLVVACYWHTLKQPRWWLTISSGLLLGISFYTYIPSRILWALFPSLLLYWLLFDRRSLRQHWLKTTVMLAIAGMVAFPLFNHLAISGDEVRLDALDGAIEAARRGDFDPLIRNTTGALKLFTIFGDDGPVSIRYNLPGRPMLTSVVGWLFYAGVALSLLAALLAEERVEDSAEWPAYRKSLQEWQDRRDVLWDAGLLRQQHEQSDLVDEIGDAWIDEIDAQMEPLPVPPQPRRTGAGNHAFTLMWLIAGLSPALITGPEAATTRAIGMQPALFIFPAIAIDFIAAQIGQRRHDGDLFRNRLANGLAIVFSIILFSYVGIDTARSYFTEWANLPDVRVQYETTRVTTIEWLNQNGDGAVAMASPRPDRFHDPSTALMTLRNDDVALRWFNGKSDDGTSGSLLLPDSENGTLMISSWSILHPELAPYLDGVNPIETLPMRETDLDRPVQIYQFNTRQLANELAEAFTPTGDPQFGDNITLLGTDVSQTENGGQTTLQVATLWRIIRPINDLKLFTHLSIDPNQPPLVGEDSLDAPSYYWQPGDVFVQYHQMTFPTLSPGEYTISVGAYTQPEPGNFQRLQISQSGQPRGDSFQIHRLTILQ